MTVTPWTILDSKVVFQHRWYTLRRDTVEAPNGRIIDDYFVSVRPDIAIVFAVTDDDRVVCVRQYKLGVRAVTLELPAGTIGLETPEAAVARELSEETGYVCSSLRYLGATFDDATKNSNLVHLFVGLGSRLTEIPQLDENESASGVEVELLSLADVLDAVRDGQIAALSSVAAIYRALDYLRQGHDHHHTH